MNKATATNKLSLLKRAINNLDTAMGLIIDAKASDEVYQSLKATTALLSKEHLETLTAINININPKTMVIPAFRTRYSL